MNICTCCESRFCDRHAKEWEHEPENEEQKIMKIKHDIQWKKCLENQTCPSCQMSGHWNVFWNRGWNYGIECANCR